MLPPRDRSRTTLRAVTVVFATALLVHGADHLRRGMNTVSTLVMTLGTIQFTLAVVVVALVFTGYRHAPVAATIVGFVSAAGFFVVHLLPDWFGPLSDSFIDAPAARRVTGFSWFAAIFEILADIAIGIAGLRAARAASRAAPVG
ncbi:hypothetical protein [Nocardia aurantia]|uniref:DoxX family protein n=1 Tax=Nocardia aurantia TaxID=2585199 RepID=A0A7K0DVE8_9NOCA|nr:hypothetical protein [Nocardia aurantia]MQY29312.1 hypothetical protein [Nocardia aurantia]